MAYEVMLNKAIELQNAGALQQAEEIYLQLLQTMPENSDVWNLLGLIAQSKGNLVKAQDCFLSAIKYAPTPFFAHFFNLGLVYDALHKTSEAEEALEKAVALKPDFKEGFLFLGKLQALNNDVSTAIKNFCKALEIDDDYEDARAYLCFYTNDLKSLFKLADEQLGNYTCQFLAALAQDDLAKKEKYLRNAISADLTRTEALIALGDLLRKRQIFNEALTFYYKVLNLCDNNLEAILGIADTYLALENFEKAEEYYLKSFKISKYEVGAHINYGSLLYRTNRLAEALEEYKTAVDISHDRADVCYNIALILRQIGEFEEALGLMFHAHLKEPENKLYAIGIMETLSEFYTHNAEAALKIAINWQKQEPDNLFSKRILSALGGNDKEVDNVEFARDLFDEFADTYDETLAKLEPQIIATFKQYEPKISGHILDLGCGTGLAAESHKNSHNRFDGVDISQNMLDVAKNKNVYENLYCEDITGFLSAHNASSYDYVLAFDVFCYMGNLAEIIQRLKGTKVCFSVETADDDRQENYYMASSGRYKHKKDYIEKLLTTYHIKTNKIVELVLRKENGEDVNGLLFFIES